jgi:hypothetical protein
MPRTRLERRLHNLDCAGKLDLAAAQHAIASSWIEAYKKYVGGEPTAASAVAPKPETTEFSGEEVWVNLRSGRYWKPGSRFYGKTSRGEYMPEIDALDRGYKPAGGTGE